MDALLWQNREPIWATCPASLDGATPILNAYFEHRQASFPAVPTPMMARMLRLVLSPRDRLRGRTMNPTSYTTRGLILWRNCWVRRS